jgi:mono/diheme cytochrome c family protein
VIRLLAFTLLFAAGAAQAADGAALFVANCAPCHQADGSGTVGLAPPLKGEHWAKLGADKGYLPMVVVHGLSGAIKVNGQTFVGSMPGFGAQFDDETLAAITTHLRGLQGGSGERVGVEDIKAARAQAGSPPQSRQRRTQILGN